MKEVKDLTPADLMDEGRRWVIARGEYIEGKGFRVEVIFEDYPFPFQIGQITNMPRGLAKTLPHFPAEADTVDAQQAACELAEELSFKYNGIAAKTYLTIVSSSLKAYDKGKRVKVLSDHPDHLLLQNGFGAEMELDEEAAIMLYQDLADALDLPCQRNCPECGGIMEGDQCEECADP